MRTPERGGCSEHTGPRISCPTCHELSALELVTRVEGYRAFLCPACGHYEEWLITSEGRTVAS